MKTRLVFLLMLLSFTVMHLLFLSVMLMGLPLFYTLMLLQNPRIL